MIDFERAGKITQEADDTLEDILSKRYDNFDQYQRVAEIQDLDVAKLVIKRLLDRLNG